jgi:CHAT domain-containing protein
LHSLRGRAATLTGPQATYDTVTAALRESAWVHFACHGSADLRSPHLASAFQLAGYRHVIGTLWPISDHHAAQLAGDFYKALASTGTASKAATALHQATHWLRNQWPQMPSAWASHTHSGP